MTRAAVPASPVAALAAWRLLAAERLAPDPAEIVVPWLAVDDEHAATLEAVPLEREGLRLQRIGLKDLDRMSSGDLVLLLFGSGEIGVGATQVIRAIRSREIRIQPLVLLGDGYFQVPEGEVFQYTQPLALLGEHCRANPIAFRAPRDLKPLSERAARYFQALGALVALARGREAAERFRSLDAELAGACDRLPEGGAALGVDPAFRQILRVRLATLRAGLAACLVSGPEAERGIQSVIDGLQRRNLEEAVAEHFATLGSARIAAGFVGTEVLDVSRMIDDFLAELRRGKGHLAGLAEDLKNVGAVASLSTPISFVGVFSSGKTTLLNQLLWGGPRLRTSSGHNTAILTEMRFDDADPPRLELEWKSSLRLDLLFPREDLETAVVSPVAGKVVEVNSTALYSVVGIEDSRDRRHDVPLGARDPIVRLGASVKLGQDLTTGISPSLRREIRAYSAFGRRDLDAIEALLERGDLEKVEVKVSQTNGKVDGPPPRQLFARLRGFLPEKYSSSLDGEAVRQAMGDAVHSITLTARLSPSHQLPRGFPLDEEGWELFQGRPGQEALAEKPECYLFLERALIYLRHDFLRLASLVDTPGLGSVTDRHDEITEWHLRNGRGLIVLFVKMDHQWEREETWRLLHLLRSLKEERTRGQVLVLCNQWSNAMPPARLVAALKKVRAWLGPGFPDIFAFDLQQLLKTGEASPPVAGFGTYEEMRNLLRKRVHELGAGKGLRKVQSDVDGLLRRRIANLERRIGALREDSQEREERRRLLEACRATLPKKAVSASMAPYERTARAYKPVVAQLDDKASWRDNREALIDVASTIGDDLDDDPFSDLLLPLGEIQGTLRRLGLRISVPELPEPPKGGLSTVALAQRIDSVLADWPWVTFSFGSYRGERQREMANWFEEKTGALLERLDKHRSKCEALVQGFYRTARKLLDDEIAGLAGSDREMEKELVAELRHLQSKVQPRWQKISDAIGKVLLGE